MAFLGHLCLGLAILGLALPLVPTVPFLLAAAAAYERSSPRFRSWLEEHPQLGPLLRNWRQTGCIPTQGKNLRHAHADGLAWPCLVASRDGLAALFGALLPCSSGGIHHQSPKWHCTRKISQPTNGLSDENDHSTPKIILMQWFFTDKMAQVTINDATMDDLSAKFDKKAL